MIEKLTFKEKLFCEAMSLLLTTWWIFLIYLLYRLRDYLVVGVGALVGGAIVIALLETLRDERENRAKENS